MGHLPRQVNHTARHFPRKEWPVSLLVENMPMYLKVCQSCHYARARRVRPIMWNKDIIVEHFSQEWATVAVRALHELLVPNCCAPEGAVYAKGHVLEGIHTGFKLCWLQKYPWLKFSGRKQSGYGRCCGLGFFPECSWTSCYWPTVRFTSDGCLLGQHEKQQYDVAAETAAKTFFGQSVLFTSKLWFPGGRRAFNGSSCRCSFYRLKYMVKVLISAGR